jgi:hypothetical protein
MQKNARLGTVGGSRPIMCARTPSQGEAELTEGYLHSRAISGARFRAGEFSSGCVSRMSRILLIHHCNGSQASHKLQNNNGCTTDTWRVTRLPVLSANQERSESHS